MYHVIINEQYFPVRDEVIDSIRTDLLDAVGRGGAFISFGEGAAQQVEVLVTPSTPVRIQLVERPEQGEGDGLSSSTVVLSTPAQEVPATDVDWWLEWS